MPAWFEARACRKSIKIHSDAAALLDDVIGADLAALDEAMERFYSVAAGELGHERALDRILDLAAEYGEENL